MNQRQKTRLLTHFRYLGWNLRECTIIRDKFLLNLERKHGVKKKDQQMILSKYLEAFLFIFKLKHYYNQETSFEKFTIRIWMLNMQKHTLISRWDIFKRNRRQHEVNQYSNLKEEAQASQNVHYTKFLLGFIFQILSNQVVDSTDLVAYFNQPKCTKRK